MAGTNPRRVVMWNLQTLDGYFEGRKPWELDWHEYVWGPELERLSIEQLRQSDGLLFGRVTYEGMAAYWATAQGEIADLMNAAPKTVFSRTLSRVEWRNARLVRAAEEEVARLRREGGRDLYVFGSANLCETLARAGLIDEYRICVVPVALGGGSPLWRPGTEPLRLRLLEARPLATGGVILRYAPADAAAGP